MRKISIIYILLFTASCYAKVFVGADVAINNPDLYFKGERIYLLTNHSGRTSDGILTADKFLSNPSINLKSIMVPEHGFYTAVRAGEKVKDDKWKNQIPIISLYGATRKPTKKILEGCDRVVVDIQDIGVRSYTYISTLFETMQACAENGKKITVLDRPNPLGGITVDGNIPDEGISNFVCRIPVTYLHGLTIGELALMINGEGWLGENLKCELEVVKMEGYERWMHWEDTDLQWFPTSPHVPTVDAVRGIATTGVFGELGFISVGVGTTLPFQYIGKPNLNNIEGFFSYFEFGGVSFHFNRYQPFYGMYSGKDVPGYLLRFSNTEHGMYYSAGFKMIEKIHQQYPDIFVSIPTNTKGMDMFKKVTGTDKLLSMLINSDFKNLDIVLENGRIEFSEKREKYLLY
ncbi:MAG: DUF1343 domain-containing protein [Candidatus Kapaibacteriales bacterium]